MAQEIISTLVDDIDEVTEEGVETHTFSMDGRTVEIDLSPENFAKLYDSLKVVFEKGRKAGGFKGIHVVKGKQPLRTWASRNQRKVESNAVREWANSNGFTVSEKGRIAENIIAAYEKRNAVPPIVAPVAKPGPVKAAPKARTPRQRAAK